MPFTASATTRPNIVMTQTDADQLSALALQSEAGAPQASHLLLEEIDRAELLDDAQVPDDVVRMHSTVQFVDEAHGRQRTVLLVYPSEADIAMGKISVLSLVGAGLIGLRPRQEIRWPDRDGHERLLRVVEVRPPERLRL